MRTFCWSSHLQCVLRLKLSLRVEVWLRQRFRVRTSLTSDKPCNSNTDELSFMNVSKTRELKVSLLVFHDRRCSFVCSSNSVSQIIGDCTLLRFSFAEQLVLCMKAEEFLSAALHTAKENVKSGQLLPSNTVKQGEHADSSFWDSISILNVCKMRLLVALNAKWMLACCLLTAVIRKLNDLYKSCVTQCHSLNRRLQIFLLDKQKLMDCFSGLTAEKLLYSHAVHMVSGWPPQSSCSVAHHRPWWASLVCLGADCSAGWNVSLWFSFAAALPQSTAADGGSVPNHDRAERRRQYR